MRKLLKYLAFITLCMACNKKIDQSNISLVPNKIGSVNDFANIIDVDSEKKLTDRITQIRDKDLAEIIICTVDSIPFFKQKFNNNPMFYVNEIFNAWHVGSKNKHNGLVIFISKMDRKITLGTGYDTEYLLPDSTGGRIIDKIIIPYFREGRYSDGIMEGLKEIEYKLDKNIRLMYPEKYK